MSTASPSNPGLLGSFRRLVDTGLGLAHNRLELFVLEFQEEKIRFAELLMLICALMAVAIVALTLLTLTVVLVFWDNGRVPALVILSMLYLVGTAWLGRLVQARLYRAPKPFAATVEELEKDKKWLQGT
jgi:uncharacterized membrane protein YqjE